MPIQAKASNFVSVEEGKHSGVITGYNQRKSTQGYDYIDILIRVDGTEIDVRPSFPLSLGKSTKLGVFFQSVGIDVEAATKKANNGMVDIEKMLDNLKGKAVSFMVLNKETQRGTFANVVPTSIKLLK